MKKMFIAVLLLGIVTSLNCAFAQSGDGPIWVSGEVASIYEDKDGAIVSLNLAGGETYNISATAKILEGIKVGDYVTVEISKGWAELIEKGDVKTKAAPKPESNKAKPQWVAGDLVAINKGQEDS